MAGTPVSLLMLTAAMLDTAQYWTGMMGPNAPILTAFWHLDVGLIVPFDTSREREEPPSWFMSLLLNKPWLKFNGSPSGRCIGLDLSNYIALSLNCSEKHRWICKRKEVNDLFDVYLDQFLSGPLEPMFYTSISNAVTDCLSDSKCTGIVQDYQYFRRTSGINTIIADKETATSYVRRECSFGFYGYNCASDCKKCYGGFQCNSVTGECPERMECIGKFKGELCELGIRNPKCPHNAPWWFYDGHCYYFEKEMKGQHAWANTRCSYYKDSHLVRIDSEKEKKWLGNMLEAESWISLLQRGNKWKWSASGEDIDPSKYSW
ncbi:uncharacterized protein LOC144586226 [Pogona vitticeps]